MPVQGSFSKSLSKNMKDFNVLIKETAKDGGDAYLSTIKGLTPVDTGLLLKKTTRSRPKKTGMYEYTVFIAAKTPYARYVEYGTAPHIITAKDKKFLSFPKAAFPVEEVHHPGHEGAHMFQRGTAIFSNTVLQPIMKKNLALFLIGGKKALRAS